MDVTSGSFEVSGTRMEEREGHKISDHAKDLNKGYEANMMLIGLTMRELRRDSYTGKDSSLKDRKIGTFGV